MAANGGKTPDVETCLQVALALPGVNATESPSLFFFIFIACTLGLNKKGTLKVSVD